MFTPILSIVVLFLIDKDLETGPTQRKTLAES